MTNPKSRVQLALELADCTFDADGNLRAHESPHWGGLDADEVATALIAGGGLSSLSIALAKVLLHLVDEHRMRERIDSHASHPAPASPSDPIAESLPGYAHEGFTAAEWASRYASLTAAAYPVLAWLPRNDPGARMVAERLEVVLAELGTTERADEYFSPIARAQLCEQGAHLERVLNERDEAKEELTRLKSDMGKVVEAARDVVECLRVGGLSDLAALVSLRLSPAITALDRTESEQAATPPEPPAPVEAPREIRVGSTVRCDFPNGTTITGEVIRVDLSLIPYLVEYEATEVVKRQTWTDSKCATWLSDPEPPAERPLGEREL